MGYLKITLFIFICSCFSLKAQSTIGGSIADENNAEPLIGATVVIKGTNEASAVDVNGNFKIVTKTNFSSNTNNYIFRIQH
jgi:hypothetical protein